MKIGKGTVFEVYDKDKEKWVYFEIIGIDNDGLRVFDWSRPIDREKDTYEEIKIPFQEELTLALSDRNRMMLEAEPKSTHCAEPDPVRVVFSTTVIDMCRKCHWEVVMVVDPDETRSVGEKDIDINFEAVWRHVRPVPAIVLVPQG